MKTWSFEELRVLCRKKEISEEVISNFSKYANSLNLRFQRAKFHAEQAHNIWKDLLAQSFSFGDEKYNEAKFSYEACVEACVLSLHPIGDILGQIINIIILQSKIPTNKIYLETVAKYMNKNDIVTKISIELNKLKNSNEYCYIKAFCNTIKHRSLITTDFRAEYGGDYRNEEGLVFIEFNYENATYPKTWAKDIIGKYRERIFEQVVEVGLKINDFYK